MLTLHSYNPAADAKALAKELSACIGTCRITEKSGKRSMVIGAPAGRPMQILKQAILKNKGAMTRSSVFNSIPSLVTEYALFVILFKKTLK